MRKLIDPLNLLNLSLDDLKAELEQLGGVPISSQILMTSFGVQLKTDMINDANKAVGKVIYT
jgi:hypothetical protein